MSHSDPSPSPSPRSDRGRWTLIVVLLLPAIVVPLLVPLYARTDPELFGFPFYFWFQLALIPAAVVLTATAFQLSRTSPPRRRDDEQDGRGEQETLR
jgi:uncharacterized membrane protein